MKPCKRGHTVARYKDGACPACVKLNNKNRNEQIRLHSQKYYADNRDAILANKAEYYAQNKATILADKAAYYRNTFAARLVAAAKSRARRKRLPFALTAADIEIPTHCPALGVLMAINEGGPGDNSPTLDRIVPELGYVPGNVVVISNLANRIKNSATSHQVLAVAGWMLQLEAVTEETE
jgi:hypothetical protein